MTRSGADIFRIAALTDVHETNGITRYYHEANMNLAIPMPHRRGTGY